MALDKAGKIAGFAQYSRMNGEEGCYRLLRIYSMPDYIGSGIGTALLKHFLEICPTLREIRAWVEEKNMAGRSFYERHGFYIASRSEENLSGYRTNQLEYLLKMQLEL